MQRDVPIGGAEGLYPLKKRIFRFIYYNTSLPPLDGCLDDAVNNRTNYQFPSVSDIHSHTFH